VYLFVSKKKIKKKKKKKKKKKIGEERKWNEVFHSGQPVFSFQIGKKT